IEIPLFQQRAPLQRIDPVADSIGVIRVTDRSDRVSWADLCGISCRKMLIPDKGRDEDRIAKKALVLEVTLQYFGIIPEDSGARQHRRLPNLVFQPMFEPLFLRRRSGYV